MPPYIHSYIQLPWCRRRTVEERSTKGALHRATPHTQTCHVMTQLFLARAKAEHLARCRLQVVAGPPHPCADASRICQTLLSDVETTAPASSTTEGQREVHRESPPKRGWCVWSACARAPAGRRPSRCTAPGVCEWARARQAPGASVRWGHASLTSARCSRHEEQMP